MKPSRDTIYTEQIAPLMTQVFDLCKAHGISCHAIFDVTEVEDDQEHFYEVRALDKPQASKRLVAQALVFEHDLGEDVLAVLRTLGAVSSLSSPSSSVS